jgi:hypothetical protein
VILTKIKSAAIVATTIAVALSVGFATPASAISYTLTADKTVVRNGEGVTFTTNAPGEKYAAFFTGEEYWGSGRVDATPNPFTWDIVGPCATVDVTYRVYEIDASAADYDEVTVAALWNQPYSASIDIRFAGDNTVDCDDSYGPGKSAEPLAKTGADSATVTGLTGVAGIAALAVAVSVARRTRRAQR